MWTEIDNHISEVTNQKFQSTQHLSVSGGCINQGYAVSNGKLTYFVKLNQATQADMFLAEMLGLQTMYKTQSIRVPQPLCWGITGNYSYIVLEWLEMTGANQQSWRKMGQNLAKMHQNISNKGFGWERNNTIGSTPQINIWQSNWIDFYVEYRLGYQFQLARRKGGNFPLQDKLLATIPELLKNHDVQPALVHGDLWGGNAGFTTDGEPVIFDPATYFGDREVDIAMTELFGGFPAVFYEGYQEVLPLNEGYKQRKIIYNLYHILNHFNLFGGSYATQANQMIKKILD
ncbi:fructosamine kinase family protein [Anabaena sp. FACHB-1237]|uniref:fructosamine kinase family protein n=1 Tax=Anabaena sp. FACHB-1237 TaxID=2692769 RepID=UPI0016816E0C|nr:fructosamine kinase family protein [Anabaena sp. FACHB-1237]MBD2137752.1 fructosamine kinase family protein [Anabaena sp. FACHB-1237]